MASDPMTRDSVFNAEESTSRSAAAAPPCLSGDQMEVFGDGLLAITRELQERPESEASSLIQWLTWLDNEGYDQASFCAALQHLCQQRLSAEVFQQLLAQASARAEAPQGLPEAIEYLSGQHPELLDEIQELEERRQSELERMLATAGGMKKSTEIEIGVGTFYAGGLVIGLVGAGRAYFRKKASDRMAAAALDTMKEKVGKQWDLITQDESIKKCHEVKNSAKKIYRLEFKMPLVKQEASEINQYSEMCNSIVKNAHMNVSLDPLEHSRIASEVETRLMATMQPEVYLRKMKEWATLERRIDGDIHEIKKIADFDIQLRREFEASKFADDFILKVKKSSLEFHRRRDYNEDISIKFDFIEEGVVTKWRDFGSQHFIGKIQDKFRDKLMQTQQKLLDEFNNNKKKLASEALRADEENSFFEIDLSDASVKSLMDDDVCEAGLRCAAKENINKFIDVKSLLFNDFKDTCLTDVMEPYLTRKANMLKGLEERTLDEEAQKLQIKEFEGTPENKVFKKLENKLRLDGVTAAENFALRKWGIERDKIIKSINDAVDDQAKKEAKKQLAALDDFQDWVDNKLKKDISLLQEFLEADVAKDIKKAYDAVLAADQKALEAERNIPE